MSDYFLASLPFVAAIFWAILFISIGLKLRKTFIDRRKFITWFLIISWVLARSLLLQRREDPSALLEKGLTIQNLIQVLIVVLATVWTSILVLTRSLKLNYLWLSPVKWGLILILVFLISAIWSVWPVYTLFRSVELLTFFILGFHVFSKENWYNQLRNFLLVLIILLIITGLVNAMQSHFVYDRVVGALRSNSGSLFAGAFFLITLHRRFYLGQSTKFWEFIFPLAALLLFGSLATVLALAAALIILLYFKTNRILRPVLAILLILVIILNLVFALENTKTFATEIAALFDKKIEHILTFTGRLPLWQEVLKVINENPAGLGFGAAERTFTVYFSSLKRIGWVPLNAHSGYIASMLGVGWFGLVWVFYWFFTVWIKAKRINQNYRPVVQSLLILLVINNFSISGIGGQFNLSWIIMGVLALACSTKSFKVSGDIKTSLPL